MTHRLAILMATAGVVWATTACGSDDGETKQPNKVVVRDPVADSPFKPVEIETAVNSLVTEIGKAPAKTMSMAILLKELIGYWQPVVTGANRAVTELEVTGDVLGNTATTPEEQLAQQRQMFQEKLAAGYNAFGIAPMATPVVEDINAAVAKGAPVVTIDSDQDTSNRQIYLGTINSEAGKTGGTTLKGLLTATSGTVVILGTTDTTWPDGMQRTQGAQDVLAAAGYTVVVRSTTWTDTGETEDVDSMTSTIQTASPPVVGMLGLFSVAFRCAMAAEKAGKTASDVTIVGFDFDANTVKYMQSGMIKATHAQRQYYMGYMAPYVLYGISALGLDKTKTLLGSQLNGARFNTGLDVVQSSQLDAYNAFLDSLGVSQ